MSDRSADTADIVEIQQLIACYAVVVDAQQWDDLDAMFTDDAHIDYTTFAGAPAGDLASVKGFLSAMLPGFRRTQHQMGIPFVTLSGDTATARTSCTNPMVAPGRDGKDTMFLIGLWYDDELRRTPEGWKFSTRTQTRCYTLTGLNDSPI